MNEKIVIITATYNHCKLLPKLYSSLKNQSNYCFKWIIVNDGSQDETDKVIQGFIDERTISIEYIHKSNSGKSSSLNSAFNSINKDQLAVIVDDDEYLDSNAVEVMHEYYSKYYDNSIGIIHFHRKNITNNEIIANYNIDKDLQMDYREFKASGRSADGYIAYFGYALTDLKFPVFNEEKYLAPGVLLMLCGNNYKMVWAEKAIGITEYIEGGITKQGRRLRVKNPLGGLYYCMLFQKKSIAFRIRLKYSIMGYAYKIISGKKKNELERLGINLDAFIRLSTFPGYLLGIYWKRKYLRG